MRNHIKITEFSVTLKSTKNLRYKTRIHDKQKTRNPYFHRVFSKIFSNAIIAC